MKYTLLQMAQIIASSMDSDEFESINDTPESLQIANVIRIAYFDLVNQSNLPEDRLLFNLNETDLSTPVLMTVPDDFDTAEWIKYNVATSESPDQNWRMLKPLSVQDFQDYTYALRESEAWVGTFNLTIGSSTVPFLYRNDKMPEFYTTIDDTQVVFDSYSSAEETNLTSARTLAQGRKSQTFDMTDTFIPPMNDDQFQLLLQEAKSLAWAELKQTPHSKAEQSARRQKILQQKNKKRVKIYKAFDELPYFGRI